MKELEKYYNEIIYIDGCPVFADLNKEQRLSLQKSYGFANYRLDIAWDKFITEILLNCKEVYERIRTHIKKIRTCPSRRVW